MPKFKNVEFDVPQAAEQTPTTHPTLRLATLDDVPELISLAEKLIKDSPIEALHYNIGKIRQSLEKFIISDQRDHLCLISHDNGKVVGVLCAYAFTPIFSLERLAAEVLWYLEPDYRKGRRGLEMMKGYEYWAKLVGCRSVQYGWMNSSPESMKKIYALTGVKLAEEVYYKEL